jgi:hypothetical protein
MPPDRPQTIALRAQPGELLKRDVGRPRLRPVESDRDPAYLALVRGCPCLKCGMDPPPNNEAAHIRQPSGLDNKRSAMGKLPPDRWTLSLCAGCHREDSDALHRIGEKPFFLLLGIRPILLCKKLYRQRGDLVAMRAVIYTAIAARESCFQAAVPRDPRPR